VEGRRVFIAEARDELELDAKIWTGEVGLQETKVRNTEREQLRFSVWKGLSIMEEAKEVESIGHLKFDAIEVVNNLFLGGEGCAHDKKGRKAKGITHVLSVLSPFEQSFNADPELVLRGRWRIFNRENRPTADLLSILDEAIGFINKALASGGKIVVHSLEGSSRSASVVVAYLMQTLRMTLKEATDHLSGIRGDDVLINRGFWRQLLAFEEFVHNGKSSMSEENLPGAIIFERAELDEIITRFRRAHDDVVHREEEKPQAMKPDEEESFESPVSPTTSTGIANLDLGSPQSKRKLYTWEKVGAHPQESPRKKNIPSLESALK